MSEGQEDHPISCAPATPTAVSISPPWSLTTWSPGTTDTPQLSHHHPQNRQKHNHQPPATNHQPRRAKRAQPPRPRVSVSPCHGTHHPRSSNHLGFNRSTQPHIHRPLDTRATEWQFALAALPRRRIARVKRLHHHAPVFVGGLYRKCQRGSREWLRPASICPASCDWLNKTGLVFMATNNGD